MAKAPPCSARTLQTPLTQQSSSSAKDEEGRWVLMEDRRSFEKLAKELLRYLDNGEKVKVGITELQDRLKVPEQVAKQARSENCREIFEAFWQEEEEEEEEGSWARRLSRLGKKMSGHKSGNTNAEQKTFFFFFRKCDRKQAQSARQSE